MNNVKNEILRLEEERKRDEEERKQKRKELLERRKKLLADRKKLEEKRQTRINKDKDFEDDSTIDNMNRSSLQFID